MKRLKVAAWVVALVLYSASISQAAVIDILWYKGGGNDLFPDYNTSFNALAASSPGGNTWSITYWDAGPMPVGSFDVLVTMSPEGGWDASPSYAALLASGITEASFGDRVMISGQDADWHYLNGPGDGTTAQAFNGPRGWLTNAINWAGSGTGMGAVILGDASSVHALFSGLGTEVAGNFNSLVIPSDFAGFPINAGLTSAGISSWNTSSHTSWTGSDLTKWTPINAVQGGACTPGAASSSCTQFVTLVKGDAGGSTTPVPEPVSLLLLGPALFGLGVRRYRRR